MTTEIKTAKGNFLLVKVPDDARTFSINDEGNLKGYTALNNGKSGWDAVGSMDEIELPEASYSIIGLTSELTEEQWREVVECHEKWFYPNYEWYNEDWYDAGQFFETAKESGMSLLRCVEIWDKNPYSENTEKWKVANERTGSWLLLKKG